MNAPDRHQGVVGREHPTHLGDCFGTDRRSGVRFRVRSEDGAYTHIVGTLTNGNDGFFLIGNGPTDQFFCTNDATGDRNGKIVVSQVNTVGVTGDGDVHTIVNDEEDIGSPRHFPNGKTPLPQLPCRRLFIPQLDGACPSVYRPSGHIVMGKAGVDEPIGHHIHSRQQRHRTNLLAYRWALWYDSTRKLNEIAERGCHRVAQGFLRYGDGRTSPLSSLEDPGAVEQWLLRSVPLRQPWALLPNFLPIGENVSTPFGSTVPIVGVDPDGTGCALLFDLKTEKMFPPILGEALGVLHWLDKLDERELETLARYFWQDPHASLHSEAQKVWGKAWTQGSAGGRGKVYVLSYRPAPFLVDMQTFLQSQGLPIQLVMLYTLKGSDGEIVAIGEQVTPTGASPLVKAAERILERVGDSEAFLQSLGNSG